MYSGWWVDACMLGCNDVRKDQREPGDGSDTYSGS